MKKNTQKTTRAVKTAKKSPQTAVRISSVNKSRGAAKVSQKSNCKVNFSKNKAQTPVKVKYPRYSLTTPDIGISFDNQRQLKEFVNENTIMRGRVYDHKLHRDFATILNNNIIRK